MRQLIFAPVLFALSILWGCGGGGAAPDNQPPRIENLQIQPSDLISSGTRVTVQATITDNRSGVQQVSVVITYPDGQSQNFSLSSVGNNQFSANFVAQWNDSALPSDYESWVVRFLLIAVDKSNNRTQLESQVRAAIGLPALPPDF